MALKGVLETLFQQGTVLVATSNRAPWELNQAGLQEDLFLHFISKLVDACDAVPLTDGPDYRKLALSERLSGVQPSAAAVKSPTESNANSLQDAVHRIDSPYMHPCGSSDMAARFDAAWRRTVVATGEPEALRSVHIMFDRVLEVPRAAGGCARLKFEQLCAEPRGSADYIALAQAFHTVFVEGVPTMSMQVRIVLQNRLACFARGKHIAPGVRLLTSTPQLSVMSSFHAHNVSKPLPKSASWRPQTLCCRCAPHAAFVQARDKARRFITLVDELYNQRTRLVCLAAAPPGALFLGPSDEADPILDLEALQSESAVPGGKLRRDLYAEAGVGGDTVASSNAQELQRLTAHLGGAEEQFAFARAVSRLLEMQTRRYWRLRGVDS